MLQGLYGERIERIHNETVKGFSEGAAFLGWRQYPGEMPSNEMNRIIEVANQLRTTAELVVIVGIGGSFLGAKAVQDTIIPYFERNMEYPEVIYAGQNLSGTYIQQLLTYMDKKEVAVIVISKSDTTTEPVVAFRILLEYMESRYGNSVAERVVTITDKAEGALGEMTVQSGLPSFTGPENIGGRYSVRTPSIKYGSGKVRSLFEP